MKTPQKWGVFIFLTIKCQNIKNVVAPENKRLTADTPYQ